MSRLLVAKRSVALIPGCVHRQPTPSRLSVPSPTHHRDSHSPPPRASQFDHAHPQSHSRPPDSHSYLGLRARFTCGGIWCDVTQNLSCSLQLLTYTGRHIRSDTMQRDLAQYTPLHPSAASCHPSLAFMYPTTHLLQVDVDTPHPPSVLPSLGRLEKGRFD